MIVITGATGNLGRLVVEGLLETVEPGGIVAGVRDPAKAADLTARGVAVRVADYERPETLAAAFAGAEKVLLVSSNELGARDRQHAAVIDAARAAGVRLFAYTSILRADTSRLMLAGEHLATERRIRASGMPFALLRNGWYLENYTEHAAEAVRHGLAGASGSGRFAAASRADYAAAAVAVLTAPRGESRAYELAGDTSFTKDDLAAAISEASGTRVDYKNLSEADYLAVLEGAGLPRAMAAMLADSDAYAALGDLDSDSADLRTLIGRPTTTLRQALAASSPVAR